MRARRHSSSRGRTPSAAIKLAAWLAGLSGLGFGIPGAIGLRHFARTGKVLTFMGFPTYGNGPFNRIGVPTSVPLLTAFLAVCAGEVALARSLWRRPRRGARLSFALLPLEAVFWIGFALPYGPLLALGRTIAIIVDGRRRH